MGGGVSQLRAEIQEHVQTAKKYPKFLEPYLVGTLIYSFSSFLFPN